MGDLKAFAAFYERESEAVLLYLVRRTLDVDLAVELTAETFAIALTSWNKLRPLAPEQARAWLFTVAQRLFGRYVRRARVERRVIQRLGMQIPAVSEDDFDLIERRTGLEELRERVADELTRLNVDQREAVRLRIVEELSYEEIAQRLGASEQTIRARVSRGLRRLESALTPFQPIEKETS